MVLHIVDNICEIYQGCNAIHIWVVHAWLNVSTQAWTSQARRGEWVTTR